MLLFEQKSLESGSIQPSREKVLRSYLQNEIICRQKGAEVILDNKWFRLAIERLFSFKTAEIYQTYYLTSDIMKKETEPSCL